MRYRLRAKELARPLEELERRRWLFENLPIDPTHAGWLRRRTWVRTIHGTTRIEGNTLSDVQVEALLAGEGSARMDEREAREVIGTREALVLVDRLALEGTRPDEAVLREVHRLVLWNQSPLLTPGEYRKGGNRAVDTDGNLVFAKPEAGDVPALMRDLGIWLASDEHGHPDPVVAAVGHLELVAIHPFNDGNGRTARALSRMALARGGYAFDGLVSLDAQLDLDRGGYFDAIRSALGSAYTLGYDATPFATYFLRSLVQSADFVLARIKGLGEVMVRIRRAIVDGPPPPAMIDGLAFAWVNRHIRARDYIRLTGRGPQTTTRDLAAAVADGWLIATGERRGRYYVLGPGLLEIPADGEITSPGR